MIDEYGREIPTEGPAGAAITAAIARQNAGQPPGPGLPQSRELMDIWQRYMYPQAEISPTTPTLSQSIAQGLVGDRPSPERRQFVGGLMGTTGLPGSEQPGLVDVTPAGTLLAAHQAGQQIGGMLNSASPGTIGDIASLGATAAGAIPAVGKAAAAGLVKPAIFAGVLAKTADRDAYNLANKMLAEGASPGDIHAATGWSQGADGKWRFEIPDQPSRFVPPVEPSRMEVLKARREGVEPGEPLGQVLLHPDLYAAYPDLADIRTMGRARAGGSYSPGDDEVITYGRRAMGDESDPERSTLLHEAEHAIQEREGFARGGNPQASFATGGPGWDIYRERLKAITQPLSLKDFARQAGYGEDIAAAKADYPRYVTDTQNAMKGPLGQTLDRAAQDYAAFEGYRRQAGEVEARNVQYRRNMSPEDLRDIPPAYTEDVPRAEQFVNLRKNYVRSAPDPASQVRAGLLAAAAKQR